MPAACTKSATLSSRQRFALASDLLMYWHGFEATGYACSDRRCATS